MSHLIPPERLKNEMIRYWMQEGEKAHAPIYQALESNPKMKADLEKFLTAMLFGKLTKDKIGQAVKKRTDTVSFTISTFKAAQAYFNALQARTKGAQVAVNVPGRNGPMAINIEFIQIAIEMLLTEAGYDIVDEQLSIEVVLPEDEVDDESEEIEDLDDEEDAEPEEDLQIEGPVEDDDEDEGEGEELSELRQKGDIVRKLVSVDGDSMRYTVVSSADEKKIGTSGQMRLQSWQSWGDPVAEEPAPA